MQTVYIGQSYQQVANAGSKPSRDFEDVLNQMHIRNIGLKRLITNYGRLWWIWNRLSAVIACVRMPHDGIVIIQYPEQPLIKRIFDTAKKQNNRIILLVHDINELRGFPSNYPEILSSADVLIVHTQAMREWVEHHINSNNLIVELDIFDYLVQQESKKVLTSFDWPIEIAFAGRLDKSPFLKKLNNLSSRLKFVLYGLGIDKHVKSYDNVSYRGACLPEELLNRISKCHFGLVWDGESISNCTGDTGQYLKYNSPYKLSSYIAAGLPVIVWNQMGMASFVKDNNIGLCVSSLEEAAEIISTMTAKEYNSMRENVSKIQTRLREGYYYRRAVSSSIKLLR